MFVLDTNVLSEVMREVVHPGVAAWLRDCPTDALFTTAVTKSEILYGIGLLPEGKKCQQLEQAATTMFSLEFSGRILPFDDKAAENFAELRIARRRAGLPISVEDGMIAAIALANEATVVTRDVGGFAKTNVALVDPWAT